MPDIQLRFCKDMLVLSAPIDAALERQGVAASRDRQYLNLIEPDSVIDALRLELMAGAQCLVTTTEDITQARLAHLNMDSDAHRLAAAALDVANKVKPQHILVEIGPCDLPLDASSRSSLNENRAQYAAAARAFDGMGFDAFFLNGFTSIADLKCALMGVGQVSGKPLFASVMLEEAPCGEADRSETPRGAGGGPAGISGDDEGRTASIGLPFGGSSVPLDEPAFPLAPATRHAGLSAAAWPDALEAMVELGAAVVGFETAEPISLACSYANRAAEFTDLPILAQLRVLDVEESSGKNLAPLAEIDDYTPDTMATAAVKLYGAGVQFLRATGAATPAYTGALAATVSGLDVFHP